MTDLDVRDLRGRAARAAIASLVGIAGSLAIAVVLPTHMHFSGCMHGEGWLVPGGDPVLMVAGAIAIALAANAILGALSRSWSR